MKRIALAVFAVLVLATPALAQPGKPAPKQPQPAAGEAGSRVKTINIGPEEVVGDRVTGKLGPISIKQAADFTSLIRIRRDYLDLIVKTGEQL